MRFSFEVVHVPGKEHYTADALSRAPLKNSNTQEEDVLNQDINAYVQHVRVGLPFTDSRLTEIFQHQGEDEVCRTLKMYTQEQWPEKWQLSSSLRPYWPHRGEITCPDGLLLFGSRILVPSALRLEMLEHLHEGHQGITKCRRRSLQSVWWPGLSTEIYDMVKNCRKCCINEKNKPEPLVAAPFPQKPWEKVGVDLMQMKKMNYIVLVDFYSRYIELARLADMTSKESIKHMKSIFARHGIPQTIISDNGTQFSSEEFKNFAREYGFTHVTSSPMHASGNGEAERAVRTVKELLEPSEDPYAALLAYRTTPLENGFSPAEMLMARRLHTKLPAEPCTLTAKVPSSEQLQSKEENARFKETMLFNRRHGAKPLPQLTHGD